MEVAAKLDLARKTEEISCFIYFQHLLEFRRTVISYSVLLVWLKHKAVTTWPDQTIIVYDVYENESFPKEAKIAVKINGENDVE